MTIKSILQFMQREDPNGTWLEWLEEIERGESSLDPVYVISVLQRWYNENAREKIYIDTINLIKSEIIECQ